MKKRTGAALEEAALTATDREIEAALAVAAWVYSPTSIADFLFVLENEPKRQAMLARREI